MLDRRNLIKALGAAAGASLVPIGLKGALSCGQPMPPYGIRPCTAGIPSDRMNTVYATQQMPEWCWAACLEMVFAYWGHPVSQQEIVRQTWGGLVNMPAQPYQIVQDLNRSWVDSGGNRFSVSGDVFSANAVTAAQDLAGDMPLILGSLGHAMVLTAITYNVAPNSQGATTGALVRDPLPGRGMRALSPQEWAGTLLLARIRIR
jgi:ABC-type bacteriocin/lantibiotic exporter with double-glycine peptidase domain